MNNQTIAKTLLDFAHFLEGREPNLYRLRAYRRAAEVVMGLEVPVARIVEEKGSRGLQELPGIGSHLGYTIAHLVCTGEFRTLSPKKRIRKHPDLISTN